jgi:DUF1680 family protein
MISDWAVMKSDRTLFLNWYGPSSFTVLLNNGEKVTLDQETDYPRGNLVKLTVRPGAAAKFTLKLRIPHWSRKTGVRVNGTVVTANAGTYLALDREWREGDRVELEFDFSFHFWAGEKECEGRTSIYRGPVLLTYDRRFNEMDPDSVPALDAAGLAGRTVSFQDWMPPILLMELTGVDGRKVRLCDFASAGVSGSPYRSWLEVKNVSPAGFARSNPLRSGRV